MLKTVKLDLKNIKQWQCLEPGDIVDVIAPSSGTDFKTLKRSLKFIESLGLQARYQPGIFGSDLLCASSDENRYIQLKKALEAKDSKVIWCLRGGYGASRLLPMLSRLKQPKLPKLIVGYSDITHLHAYVNYKWQWPSLHASMLEEVVDKSVSKKELNDLKNILFSHKKNVIYKNLKPLNDQAKESKLIRSTVTGGNLTIILASLGTPYQAHAKGQILAIEDIGERGYRVDRMLVQLQQAGYFNGIRALIFGDFVGGVEKDSKALWKDVQKRFAKSVNFPVLKNLPLGHSTKQRPVPLMTRAKLQLGDKPTIEIATGVKDDYH